MGSAGDKPFFSVIMPVYNHAGYLRQAVESVREQSVADWELILVDDGSTDGSGELVDELAGADDRIAAIHQPNAGPAAARNAALRRARADWLAYIDSDDLWYPDALAAYRRAIDRQPEAVFFHGYRHRLSADGSITELLGQFQDRPTGAAELFERMYLSHLCVCYRRELIDRAGGYDDRLRSCEDYDLYLRMSLHCRFHPLAKATGLRRRHATNISRQTGHSRMVEAMVLRRFVETLGGADVLEPGRICRRLGRVYYSAARQHFKARCHRQAVDAADQANRYRRTLKSTFISVAARCLLPLGRSDGRELPDI